MSILEFRNVSFQYAEDQKMILRDVSLTMDSGKTYALVGPTGEGKSTTASLISRLYEPTSGQILLRDKDLREWDALELYWEVGFILQEPYLYSGTVLDNIIYGNPDYKQFSSIFSQSEEESIDYSQFEQVLKQKNLFSLVSNFSEGLSTMVTNNSENISLGQKQIINFMRVILRDPSFLILDEATANLDTVTEQSLQVILDELPASTTKLIIAHRLNTIKVADQVFMVGGGKVQIESSW
ncbi:MAG: ATP-binding cassette domain-containing protein [Patescibacteria group bacterium]